MSESEEHPLFFELKTTRAALARHRYDEAHLAATKLQRHSLEAIKAHERAVHLERENDVLRAELAVLRGTPHSDAGGPSAVGSQTHIQELTLSLRKISQKLTLTEDALLERTNALVSAQADVVKARAQQDAAYELGARVRGREEAGKSTERELELRIRKLEEEVKMGGVVVGEYAALVRGMEGRAKAAEGTTNGHAHQHRATPSASFAQGKRELQQVVEEFKVEKEKLAQEIDRLTGELEVAKSRLVGEKKGEDSVLSEFARTRTELDKLRIDDGTAAKMVSRYMQFSQTSTNSLLASLETLKTRHNATLSTLTSQNHLLASRVRSLESQNEHLRNILDDLGGEVIKEKFGRRREVGLRIRMGGREERVVEGLRRWLRRGDEALGKSKSTDHGVPLDSSQLHDAVFAMTQDARILLESLDEGGADEETALSLSGSRARELAVVDGLEGLLEELRKETEKRVSLELAASDEQLIDADLDERPPQVPAKSPIALSTQTASMSRKTDERKLPVPSVGSTPTVILSVPPPESQDSSKTPTLATLTPKQAAPEPTGSDQSSPELPPANTSTSPLQATSNDSSVPPHVNLEPIATREITPEEELKVDVPLPQPSLETAPPLPAVPIPAVEVPLQAGSSQSHLGGTASTLATPAEAPPAPSVPMKEVEDVLNESSSQDLEDASGQTHVRDDQVDDGQPDAENTPISQGTLDINGASSITFPSSSTVEEAPPSPIPATALVLEDIQAVPALVPVQEPHPLLAELNKVSKRYDDIQKSFRDCHLALESLKASLSTQRPSVHSNSRYPQTSSASQIPFEVLSAAVGRLDDYTEDARVELEIRVGDEVLVAKGYEALLSVPGALASARPDDGSSGRLRSSVDEDQPPTQNEVEGLIEAFVLGTDVAVKKAREGFTKKLEDVQHDIAQLKRAVHDPDSFFSDGVPGSVPGSASASTTNLVPSAPDPSANGSGWSSWIRGGPRSSTPAPPVVGPSPTFGNIMTNPRLRHSPSLGAGQLSSGVGGYHPNGQAQAQEPERSRRGSFFGLLPPTLPSSSNPPDPFGALGLRVPMPTFSSFGAGLGSAGIQSPPLHSGASANGGYSPFGVVSPTHPSPGIGMGPMGARTRTVSTMYMIGLGAAGAGGGGPPKPMSRSVSAASGMTSPLGHGSRQSSISELSKGDEEEEDLDDSGSSDVE